MSDEANRKSPSDSGDGLPGSDSSGESAQGERVESLVAGRSKRVTAGNRLSTLVDNEQDDVNLLFEVDELEEDASFDEDEADASDVNLETSSDEEENEGGKDANDELAGEKDLQREARQETKKRKAKDRAKIRGVARKRVKIDPTAIEGPARPRPRPKKKSERLSWIATPADAPTRVSSRKHTVQNRESVHKRLVDGEKHRKRIMRQMEEAQKRRDATRPKALTQAQRMEEAAKMEKKNAKSLTRWEESEKARVAEQKARLEALHNRQLSGPVIAWWSGFARWVNGKMIQLGAKAIHDAGHGDEFAKARSLHGGGIEDIVTAGLPETQASTDVSHNTNPTAQPNRVINLEEHSLSLPSPAPGPSLQTRVSSVNEGPDKGLRESNGPAALPGTDGALNATTTPMEIDGATFLPPHPPHEPDASLNGKAPGPLGGKVEYVSQNVVALKSIDANVSKPAELQSSVLVKKQKMRLQRPVAEHCVISGQAARFREPQTGLAFANAYAYQAIERLTEGGSRWSNLLECYVGSSSSVARGVPERFQQTG